MAMPPECSSGEIPESEMELPPRIGIAAAIEPVETIGVIEAHGAETRQVDLNTHPRTPFEVSERDVAELVPDVAGVIEHRRIDGVRDLDEVLGRHEQESVPAVVRPALLVAEDIAGRVHAHPVLRIPPQSLRGILHTSEDVLLGQGHEAGGVDPA